MSRDNNLVKGWSKKSALLLGGLYKNTNTNFNITQFQGNNNTLNETVHDNDFVTKIVVYIDSNSPSIPVPV